MTSHGSKPEASKPNYTFRRVKFAVAIIGFVSSMTLLFTWHVTDRHMAWLVARNLHSDRPMADREIRATRIKKLSTSRQSNKTKPN